MKRLLFYLAIFGWLSSVTINILSVQNIDVQQTIPFIYILYVGALIVISAVILDQQNDPDYIAHRQSGILNRMNPVSQYKILFKNTPVWIVIITMACVVYAFINFIQFDFHHSGVVHINNGQYCLENRGELIRVLTEKEYHWYRAQQTKSTSSMCMVFYGVAVAKLFSYAGRIRVGKV
ncbi:hypothetical protein Q765_16670 [Flavobacterium rivuli WB 3.3-2 = DSM 21788]|uniref:Uncharacterized protein n=1 Tax=Flavobacterium rivuli WB 3.3-2 = DSM 21788 TaxID=1121895 RepID=A0A0A2M186_9FLAO|nr:hypothetical protein [Flavobacterium rivuli]KGO85376.1 hypothetical protein Q765_16670 [Flavobacterium rivuli WB 3.3-2 = DSM 21788]